MAEEADPATELCLGCGLCCRGMLHARAVLDPDEVAPARELGLNVLDRVEPAFSLPCARFEDRCTIYQARPRACVRYKCALLRKAEAGEVSFEQAKRIVADALRLMHEADQGMPAADFMTEFRSTMLPQGAAARPAGAGSDLHQLRMTALAYFLDKHFVLPREGSFFSSRIVDGSAEKGRP